VIQNDTQINQDEKTDLESQLAEETQLRQVQQLQESDLQAQKQKKNTLISQTKGQEQAFQSLIKNKQQTAAEIRAALFQLTGTHAIPFGTALQYAQLASQRTGIRPAFLLGIIAEESNLGENVGKGNWQTDMGPGQKAMFQVITSSLGLNPDSMPVSKKQFYGFGGAMGPAQFIPNTWAGYAGYTTSGYDASRDRIGPLTGNHPPNPWNPQDAFMASAIFLTDNGAGAGTRQAEFRAAMCYLAGCGGVNNPDLQFYGNQVASLAAGFQTQIDILSKAQ
jgi:membrane-bound lytic murein transglycosylase B